MANLSNPWSHRRRCFKHLHWQVLLQYLNGSRVKFRMSFCNEGLMPFSVMIVWPNYGDLGYDLGYLRHGSFGRAARAGPADRARGPACPFGAACPWCCGPALYGLPGPAEGGPVAVFGPNERLLFLLGGVVLVPSRASRRSSRPVRRCSRRSVRPVRRSWRRSVRPVRRS